MIGNSVLGSQTEASTTLAHPGKYPALVLNEEPPAAALARGELYVQVPGILEDVKDGEGQQPIELLAKPCFPPGVFYVPEPGDHIWVEFAGGDINAPIWSGLWYPDDASPQTADAAAPSRYQKILRSATGHVIQLDDSDSEEQIIIYHRSGSAITIDADGNITITGADTITMTATDLTLDGNVQITGDTAIDGLLTVGTGPSTTIDKNEITGG